MRVKERCIATTIPYKTNWQEYKTKGFDRNLFNSDAVYASIRYIEDNPVRSDIVTQANEYRWSSAWIPDEKEKWRPELDRKSLPVRMVNRV